MCYNDYMAYSRSDALENIGGKYKGISFCLNERSRRIWAATEAKSYGWGGITIVSEATGIDHKTIRKGILELDDKENIPGDSIRRKGGGRKKLKYTQKDLLRDLESLVEPLTRGDTESPLRWT